MVGQLNDIANVSTAVKVKGTAGVVKAVYVTIAHAGDKIHFLDSTDNTGVTQFFVEADGNTPIPLINRTFNNGIYCTVTGSTARYVVVFE